MKKIILIPPCFTFGDCLSVIGLLYYLLNHYDVVCFYVGNNPDVITYYNNFFKHDSKLNNKIVIITDPAERINKGYYGEFHICNLLTHDWSGPNTIFKDLPNVNPEHYFNDSNPINTKLDITDDLVCIPNKHMPSKITVTNHIFYYELIGLNNNVRMNYFECHRDVNEEKMFKKLILENLGLKDGDKYNIINDPVNKKQLVSKYIKNDFPVININYLAPSPNHLLTLLEDAESIHFIEGCNVNFYYHCQYKGLFNYSKPIYFHIWARNRNWNDPNMNLDFAWKMMDSPRLDNWVFLHNEIDAQKI